MNLYARQHIKTNTIACGSPEQSSSDYQEDIENRHEQLLWYGGTVGWTSLTLQNDLKHLQLYLCVLTSNICISNTHVHIIMFCVHFSRYCKRDVGFGAFLHWKPFPHLVKCHKIKQVTIFCLYKKKFSEISKPWTLTKLKHPLEYKRNTCFNELLLLNSFSENYFLGICNIIRMILIFSTLKSIVEC